MVGIWGQTRCLGAAGANRGTDTIFDVRHTGGERLTCNVQLSRFNGVTERGHVGRDMGTDTICGGRLMLPGHPDMGTGTISWGQARCRVYPIRGQTRCPVYRSGTFNVQRSTLNFQRGDRKGAWWPGYGDRHDVWGLSAQIEGQTRYSMSDILVGNVQRATFNSQGSTG